MILFAGGGRGPMSSFGNFIKKNLQVVTKVCCCFFQKWGYGILNLII